MPVPMPLSLQTWPLPLRLILSLMQRSCCSSLARARSQHRSHISHSYIGHNYSLARARFQHRSHISPRSLPMAAQGPNIVPTSAASDRPINCRAFTVMRLIIGMEAVHTLAGPETFRRIYVMELNFVSRPSPNASRSRRVPAARANRHPLKRASEQRSHL